MSNSKLLGSTVNQIFGGALAVVLVVVYVGAIFFMVKDVITFERGGNRIVVETKIAEEPNADVQPIYQTDTDGNLMLSERDMPLECIRRENGPKDGCYPQGYLNFIVTISGLLSALVIATLSIAKPGEIPGVKTNQSNEPTTKVSPIIVFIYLSVWLGGGVVAVVVGVLWKPGVLSSLSDIGNGWLGMAVAAAYAYFGIKPKEADASGGGGSGDAGDAAEPKVVAPKG